MNDQKMAVEIVWNRPSLNIYHLADVHVGAAAFSEEAAAAAVAKISADPDALVLGGGDYIEAVAPTDRRWDPAELSSPITEELLGNPFYVQALRFAKIFEPIRDKIHVLIPGNHEYTAARRFYIEPTTIMAERLSAKVCGLSTLCTWIRIIWRQSSRTRTTYTIYLAHGHGGGELAGGLALKLERTLYRKDADLVLIGHHHRPAFLHKQIEAVGTKGHIWDRTRVGVIGYPMCSGHNYIARSSGENAPQGMAITHVDFATNQTPSVSVTFDVFSQSDPGAKRNHKNA